MSKTHRNPPSRQRWRDNEKQRLVESDSDAFVTPGRLKRRPYYRIYGTKTNSRFAQSREQLRKSRRLNARYYKTQPTPIGFDRCLDELPTLRYSHHFVLSHKAIVWSSMIELEGEHSFDSCGHYGFHPDAMQNIANASSSYQEFKERVVLGSLPVYVPACPEKRAWLYAHYKGNSDLADLSHQDFKKFRMCQNSGYYPRTYKELNRTFRGLQVKKLLGLKNSPLTIGRWSPTRIFKLCTPKQRLKYLRMFERERYTQMIQSEEHITHHLSKRQMSVLSPDSHPIAILFISRFTRQTSNEGRIKVLKAFTNNSRLSVKIPLSKLIEILRNYYPVFEHIPSWFTDLDLSFLFGRRVLIRTQEQTIHDDRPLLNIKDPGEWDSYTFIKCFWPLFTGYFYRAYNDIVKHDLYKLEEAFSNRMLTQEDAPEIYGFWLKRLSGIPDPSKLFSILAKAEGREDTEVLSNFTEAIDTPMGTVYTSRKVDQRYYGMIDLFRDQLNCLDWERKLAIYDRYYFNSRNNTVYDRVTNSTLTEGKGLIKKGPAFLLHTPHKLAVWLPGYNVIQELPPNYPYWEAETNLEFFKEIQKSDLVKELIGSEILPLKRYALLEPASIRVWGKLLALPKKAVGNVLALANTVLTLNPWEEAMDPSSLNQLLISAMKLMQVLGSYKEVIRWIQQVREVDITSDLLSMQEKYLAVHDAGQFDTVSHYKSWYMSKYKNEWKGFLFKFPNAVRYLGKQDKVDAHLDSKNLPFPKKVSELKDILAQFTYKNVTDATEGIAKIAFSFTQKQESFDKYVKLMRTTKIAESIPHASINSGDYSLTKLDAFDIRGPFLGLFTNCCQHLTSQGAPCAEHGWLQPGGAFFVLTYKDKIVAQSWVWRSKKGVLCFDSIESLDAAYAEKFASLLMPLAKQLINRLGINTIAIGKTDYGMTEQVLDRLVSEYGIGRITAEHKPADKCSYMDGRTQVLVLTSDGYTPLHHHRHNKYKKVKASYTSTDSTYDIVLCEHCESEVDYDAVTCPSCGENIETWV